MDQLRRDRLRLDERGLGAGGLILPAEPFTLFGALLMLAGSGIAAFALLSCVARLWSADRPRFGRWAWRLWLALVLWLGWVPVPVKATITYWHTVAY